MSYSNYTDHVRYNGDWIVTETYIDQWYPTLEEFMLELDRQTAEARQDAIDCYINLKDTADEPDR